MLKGIGLRLGSTTWEVVWKRRAALHQDRRGRRHHARPGPRAGRDDGRDLRHRQLQPAESLSLFPRPPTASPRRWPTSSPRPARPAPGLADLPGPGAVLHHLRGAGAVQAAARAARRTRGRAHEPGHSTPARRRQPRAQARQHHHADAVAGGDGLRRVLADLDPGRDHAARHRRPGARGVHRDDAAAAGRDRRPGNAIFGSVRDGRAGHLHRHADRHPGRHLPRPNTARRAWLGATTRFINDILLSAPSIVIGLFIYSRGGGAFRASPAGPACWRWR